MRYERHTVIHKNFQSNNIMKIIFQRLPEIFLK